MLDSPIHQLINDIRKRYSGKNASILDIRRIEDNYKLCSFVNIRNDNCAFLRITSFGFDEVVFEDIVIDLDLVKKFSTQDELMYNISRTLFNLAYGVILVDSDTTVIDVPIVKPDYDFNTLKEENNRLLKKIEELENKLTSSSLKNGQMSIFDQDD